MKANNARRDFLGARAMKGKAMSNKPATTFRYGVFPPTGCNKPPEQAKPMRLWEVRAICTPIPYDSYDSMVVRARTELEALTVANAHGWGDMGKLDTTNVEVKAVDVDGPAEVVHASFKAG